VTVARHGIFAAPRVAHRLYRRVVDNAGRPIVTGRTLTCARVLSVALARARPDVAERSKRPIVRWMQTCRTALLVGVILCWCSLSAFAQGDSRGFVHGDFGYGSKDDDEGSLGKGLAFGGAIGGAIIDEVEAEFSVTRMHHQRSMAIGWEGDVTSYMGRVMYRSGGPASTARWFVGAGVGYYFYSGVISETIIPSLASSPSVDRFDYSLHGLAYETGAGAQFGAGGHVFVRPELWVTIARGERTPGGRTPEPPFLIARVGFVIGLRF
jgi:OprF membrane domain